MLDITSRGSGLRDERIARRRKRVRVRSHCARERPQADLNGDRQILQFAKMAVRFGTVLNIPIVGEFRRAAPRHGEHQPQAPSSPFCVALHSAYLRREARRDPSTRAVIQSKTQTLRGAKPDFVAISAASMHTTDYSNQRFARSRWPSIPSPRGVFCLKLTHRLTNTRLRPGTSSIAIAPRLSASLMAARALALPMLARSAIRATGRSHLPVALASSRMTASTASAFVFRCSGYQHRRALRQSADQSVNRAQF
jgi:hypothetical protein